MWERNFMHINSTSNKNFENPLLKDQVKSFQNFSQHISRLFVTIVKPICRYIFWKLVNENFMYGFKDEKPIYDFSKSLFSYWLHACVFLCLTRFVHMR